MRFIYTKTFAAFFIALVLVVGMIFLNSKGWLQPLRTVILQTPRPVIYIVAQVGKPTQSFFSTIYNLRSITKENNHLTAELFAAQQQLVDLDQLRRENEALRNELDFKQNTTQNYQSCSVLSVNPLGLTGTLVINCGSAQGVQPGAAVVSQGYLVGKIIYAAKTSSTVLLATDSKFSADARISKTGASGIVRGSFGSGLLLDQLSQSDVSDKGMLVVTAGISEQIPKNIIIGQIGDILSGPNDLFKKTTLISPIDFGNLEFVFVAK